MTGFYRDGYCRTGPGDVGLHTVCIEATEEFLNFSFLSGNDLSTPAPEWDFPGLKPGDRWCLVAVRWVEAHEAGMAPRVVLLSTHEAVTAASETTSGRRTNRPRPNRRVTMNPASGSSGIRAIRTCTSAT